ncbi:MAG TPA: 3-oxoacyl-ACP synthase [Sulfobacillus sp.]|nr:3-oxoacyl-ACP synthase [Sulfobacillus sp.]
MEKIVETSDEWIVTRTGIRERHIAGNDETTSSMATEASRRALRDAKITAEDLDFIVCATNTPDTIFPSTAARVQHQLTEKPIPGFDLQAGCTGLIYGMETASALIKSGKYRNILVIGADKLTSITDYEDRTTAVLFGDAAGAFVLQANDNTEFGILSSYLQADGRGGDLLIQPGGGSLMPASKESVETRQHYLKMNGNETFRFAVKALPEAVEEGLKRAGLEVGDMDLLVPHQANLRIIDAAVRRFELSPERVVINIDRYGNTSVATIPLALQEARMEGRLHDGDVVVLCAFGAGLTWGSNVIRWGR